MSRHLYVKYRKQGVTSGQLQVVEQSHRGDDFTDNTALPYRFTHISVNGDLFSLDSQGSPVYDPYDRRLYVQGASRAADGRVIEINGKLPHVLNMILSYNQAYTKNKLVLEDVAEEVTELDAFRVHADFTLEQVDDDDGDAWDVYD